MKLRTYSIANIISPYDESSIYSSDIDEVYRIVKGFMSRMDGIMLDYYEIDVGESEPKDKEKNTCIYFYVYKLY